MAIQYAADTIGSVGNILLNTGSSDFIVNFLQTGDFSLLGGLVGALGIELPQSLVPLLESFSAGIFALDTASGGNFGFNISSDLISVPR